MGRELSIIVLVVIAMLSSMPSQELAATATQSRHVRRADIGAQSADVALHVDGAHTFQRIDGFGVNANGASWADGTLAPALDLLADTMEVKIWRVILEQANWEAVNDNPDPFTFNWDYYNTVYESPKFQSVWNIIAYLNKNLNGILDNLRKLANVGLRVTTWRRCGIFNSARGNAVGSRLHMVLHDRPGAGLVPLVCTHGCLPRQSL